MSTLEVMCAAGPMFLTAFVQFPVELFQCEQQHRLNVLDSFHRVELFQCKQYLRMNVLDSFHPVELFQCEQYHRMNVLDRFHLIPCGTVSVWAVPLGGCPWPIWQRAWKGVCSSVQQVLDNGMWPTWQWTGKDLVACLHSVLWYWSI